MEQVEADDIRTALQDALGSAEDENNVSALKRILEHLALGPLDTLGQANQVGNWQKLSFAAAVGMAGSPNSRRSAPSPRLLES